MLCCVLAVLFCNSVPFSFVFIFNFSLDSITYVLFLPFPSVLFRSDLFCFVLLSYFLFCFALFSSVMICPVLFCSALLCSSCSVLFFSSLLRFFAYWFRFLCSVLFYSV